MAPLVFGKAFANGTRGEQRRRQGEVTIRILWASREPGTQEILRLWKTSLRFQGNAEIDHQLAVSGRDVQCTYCPGRRGAVLGQVTERE